LLARNIDSRPQGADASDGTRDIWRTLSGQDERIVAVDGPELEDAIPIALAGLVSKICLRRVQGDVSQRIRIVLVWRAVTPDKDPPLHDVGVSARVVEDRRKFALPLQCRPDELGSRSQPLGAEPVVKVAHLALSEGLVMLLHEKVDDPVTAGVRASSESRPVLRRLGGHCRKSMRVDPRVH